MSSLPAFARSKSQQNGVPNQPHRSPERPRGGRSKRKLIESACAACQKRKSRCDGQRPVCSRCQALNTDCGYNAEQGESRWSALCRRNRILERERDEARDLIAQMQSRSESEAQEMYHRIRTNTHTSDLRASVHEASDIVIHGASQQQPQQQQRQQQKQKQQDQQHEHDYQYSQHQQPQQQPQRQVSQQLPQQQDPNAFFQPDDTITETTYQLPPLRSIVGVPTAINNPTQLQLQQQLPQPSSSLEPRNMSQVSAMSSGSYTSLSSSDGHSRHSQPPRTNQPRGQAHGNNN